MNAKTILSVFLLLICISARSQITNPAPYCASEHMFNYNMVNSITVSGQQHLFGPAGGFGITSTYLYYNNITFPTLALGATVQIDLDFYIPNDLEPTYFALWIDFDGNNTFDAAELVLENSNTSMALLPVFNPTPGSPSNITGQFTVPANATPGMTRMRLIRGTNEADPYGPYDPAFSLSPCIDVNSFAYGCVFDMDVTLGAAGPAVLINSIGVSGQGGATTITATGGTLQMEATVAPANATNKTLTWSVTNGTGSATIDQSGLLTATSDGTVVVTGTASDGSGISGDATITISNQNPPVLVTGITVSGQGGVSTISASGGTLQMEATVVPGNATNQAVTWSLTNGTGTATISATGLLTAVSDGTVIVNASANDNSGVTANQTITLSNQTPIILVNSISVSAQGGAWSIATDGGTLQMIAKILPSNATNQGVSWSVDSSHIASITSTGLLTAISDGTVKITAKAIDGSGISSSRFISVGNQNVGIDQDWLSGISIFPNPSTGIIKLHHTAPLPHNTRLEVYGVDGRIVYASQLIDLQSGLDLSPLGSGIYFLRFRSEDSFLLSIPTKLVIDQGAR